MSAEYHFFKWTDRTKTRVEEEICTHLSSFNETNLYPTNSHFPDIMDIQNSYAYDPSIPSNLSYSSENQTKTIKHTL